MKRYLLTAASALVLTASASAQTFQISGEVVVSGTYDGATNVLDGPWLVSNDMMMTLSGSGGGWDYEIETDLTGDPVQVTLDNPTLGTFELRQSEIEWRRNLLGDTLMLSTQFAPQDVLDTLMIGLEGTAAGVSYEAQIMNNADRDFQLQLQLPLMGVEFEADVVGNLADTSLLDYGMQAGFDAFGIDTTVSWTSMGDIGVEAAAGAFYAESDLTVGDLFSRLMLGYRLDVTEQMEVHASVGMDGSSTSGSAEMYLRF